MSITKEFLENLGVSAEAANAIFAERGKEITESKSKIDELTSQNAKLTEDINSLNTERENLSKVAGDAEAYKKKIAEYEAEAAEKTKRLEAEAADKALTEKIEALFKDKKFASEYAHVGLVNDIKAKFAESGNTLGLSEICDALTKDKTGIFESTHKKLSIPQSGSGSGATSSEELLKMKQMMGFPSVLNNK